MRSRYGPVLVGALTVLGAMAMGAVAHAASHEAASLDAARALYAERLFESAGVELREIVASDADAEIRATALRLLGRIAVEEGRYGEALVLWTDLAEEYAGTAAAQEAATERRLVEALVECRGEAPPGLTAEAGTGGVASAAAAAPAPPPSTPASAPSAPTAPVASPAPTAAATPPTSAAASAPDASPMPSDGAAVPQAAPAPPTPATAGAPATSPAPTPGLVLVAGRGKPYDAVREAIGEFTGFLVERGVAAESPTEGIALVEESASALERLLEAARERGAESLLHVEAQFGHRERIEIECYRPDGELLWREKVTGGMGFSERTMNEKLVRRLEEKLAERVGGPGLPVGGSAGR